MIGPYLVGAVAVLATLAAAGAGTRPTTAWYTALAKPSWQPDPSVIGLAWTIVYPLIAVSLGLVWNRTSSTSERTTWLVAAGVNLALNAGWSWTFFVAQRPWLAAAEIGLLLLSCVLLVGLAGRVSGVGALLLVPYAAWVGFAGYLTLTLARLN